MDWPGAVLLPRERLVTYAISDADVKLHNTETQSVLHIALAKESSTRLERPLEKLHPKWWSSLDNCPLAKYLELERNSVTKFAFWTETCSPCYSMNLVSPSEFQRQGEADEARRARNKYLLSLQKAHL
jgi:hypothetical protein